MDIVEREEKSDATMTGSKIPAKNISTHDDRAGSRPRAGRVPWPLSPRPPSARAGQKIILAGITGELCSQFHDVGPSNFVPASSVARSSSTSLPKAMSSI